ncbi:MAG: ATP-binding protein [Eggerthellaceae bacterium]|nr:ATP-binding protein [Eggerthellaceae bacterium]
MNLEASCDLEPAPGSAAQALAFLEESLDAAAVPLKQKNRFMVVFDDMYANIVNYSGASRATVSVTRVADRAVITLRDNGSAFDPLAAEDPDITAPVMERNEGGLGILMMKRMTDEVSYERDQGENVLRMVIFVREA